MQKSLAQIKATEGRDITSQVDNNTLVYGETGSGTGGAFNFMMPVNNALANYVKGDVDGLNLKYNEVIDISESNYIVGLKASTKNYDLINKNQIATKSELTTKTLYRIGLVNKESTKTLQNNHAYLLIGNTHPTILGNNGIVLLITYNDTVVEKIDLSGTISNLINVNGLDINLAKSAVPGDWLLFDMGIRF